MDTGFRIRYRAQQDNGTSSALVVEDREGVFYLFSRGQLQVRFSSLAVWQRVCTCLARARYTCYAVEGDDLHPLEALPTLEGGLVPAAP